MNWWNQRVIRLAACAAIGIAAFGPSASPADEKTAAATPANANAGAAKLNAPEEPKDMVRLFKNNSLEGWDDDPVLDPPEPWVVIPPLQ